MRTGISRFRHFHPRRLGANPLHGIVHRLVAEAIDELLARGITPSVLKSANFEDGPEYNKKLAEYYEKTGY